MPSDWVATGEQAIQKLLAQEHAVVLPEIEARLADATWPTLSHPVQPHHLTTARHNLVTRDVIQVTREPTRAVEPFPSTCRSSNASASGLSGTQPPGSGCYTLAS